MTDLLANPIWHSLSTLHSDLAQGNQLAKRYPEANVVSITSGLPKITGPNLFEPHFSVSALIIKQFGRLFSA